MHDPRSSMWAEAVAMLDRAERLHRQFFRLMVGPTRTPTWEPPIDVFEEGDQLAIVVALPGIPPERIQVGMKNDVLIIAGERPMPVSLRSADIRRLEIPYGRFERHLELTGTFEFTQQELQDGCLTLFLRKV